MTWAFAATVPGQLGSKSNSRRIVPRGGRFAVIKSQDALDYVATFARFVPRPKAPFAGPVRLTVRAFYKDNRRDLDTALLHDCLQNQGVILNDRQIKELHAYRLLDRLNPRVEFELEELENA